MADFWVILFGGPRPLLRRPYLWTTVHDIGINKVWGFLPTKYLLSDSMAALVRHSQAQKCLQINSKTFALNCYEIFKISYLTDFSTDWLTIWLTIWLMPSDKCNSITAKAIGLISSLFNVTSSQDVPFANCCSFNAHIMVLPKLTFVLLCSWFLFPLLCRWRFVVALLRGFMEDLVTEVIAEVFNTLFFCLNRFVNC